MKLRWHRYRIVILGLESGSRHPLPHLTFRHWRDAQQWCRSMNTAHPSDMTTYTYERIP